MFKSKLPFHNLITTTSHFLPNYLLHTLSKNTATTNSINYLVGHDADELKPIRTGGVIMLGVKRVALAPYGGGLLPPQFNDYANKTDGLKPIRMAGS